jgi:non-ribosomal peptide synthetase component E (peptide arylation enzyme)
MKAIYTASDHINELKLKAEPISEQALAFTIDWLGSFETNAEDLETLQLIANASAYFQKDLNKRVKSRVQGRMKREYAKAHGLKLSQVRIVPAQKGGE